MLAPARQSHLFTALILSLISCFFHLTHAAPIQPPDLAQCFPASASSVVGTPLTLFFNCCLTLPTRKVVDFSFDRYPPVKRIRAPAHKASQEYIVKYTRAYELMKALPADDPRSFAKQADVHCAFCNGAYKQLGSNVTLEVHYSWLFLPWHRWYLYFHERILAKLIDDPSFSLLFWNWDNQKEGNVMPAVFTKNGTAIYDPKRNQQHLPPEVVALNAQANTTDKSVLVRENLNQMYQGLVKAKTAERFLGGAYRAGSDDSNSTVLSAPLAGSLESGVHNAIHFWTGDPDQQILQDMGTFPTAARDPIFFAHHSNVDRLWEVWKTLPGGRRKDHTDLDFLNAEFVFYDENANLVKVKVRDALDSRKLGVRYKKVKADALWKNFSPQAASKGSAASSSSSLNVPEIGSSVTTENVTTIELGKQKSAIVKQPSPPSAELLRAKGVKKAEDLEEVLVIEGVEVMRDTFVQLLVFVNLPGADEKTKIDSAEYVGSFNVIPKDGESRLLITDVKFEIGDNLKRIGIQDAEKVIVTIVVKAHAQDNVRVKIKGMRIEYQ